MTQHVMIDLETLGTKAGSVILSLGAVKFDPMTEEPFNQFYVSISAESAQDYDLTIDAKTVMWWFDDDRSSARAVLMSEEKVDLVSALEGFTGWYGKPSLPTWGNAATFDNALLRVAFEKTGLECPWKYGDDRCYRTLKNLVNVPFPVLERSIHHHALADACNQAHHLRAIVKVLGLKL